MANPLPIARPNFVYNQILSGDHKLGVVAFSYTGIDRVEFRFTGADPYTSQLMSQNDESNTWEYWYPFSGSNFPNGRIDYTIDVYDNAAVSRTLTGTVTNYTGGTFGGFQETMWVDSVNGSATGDGSQSNPFDVISDAYEQIVTNVGDRTQVGGGTIYLNTGGYVYTTQNHLTAQTGNTYITIKGAPNTNREDVAITGSANQGFEYPFVAFHDLTISGTQLTARTPTQIQEQQHYYCSGVDFRTDDTGMNPDIDYNLFSNNWGFGWFVDCRIIDKPGGFKDSSQDRLSLVRNCIHSGHLEDLATNVGCLVNYECMKYYNPNNVAIGGAGIHPDLYQSTIAQENVILYGVRAPAINQQPLFVDDQPVSGVAFVNIFAGNTGVLDSALSVDATHVLYYHITLTGDPAGSIFTFDGSGAEPGMNNPYTKDHIYIKNCILHDLTFGQNALEQEYYDGTGDFMNSIIMNNPLTGATDVSGNLDPQFNDPINWDYSIKTTSPAYKAGTTLGLPNMPLLEVSDTGKPTLGAWFTQAAGYAPSAAAASTGLFTGSTIGIGVSSATLPVAGSTSLFTGDSIGIGVSTNTVGLIQNLEAAPGLIGLAITNNSIDGITQNMDGSGIGIVVGSAGFAGSPSAAFTGSPLTGNAPLNVWFTDLSTNNPTSWLWNFGDGVTSTGQNPVHGYTQTGIYDVSLTATNTVGSDIATESGYIGVSIQQTFPTGPSGTPTTPGLSSDIYLVGPNQTYKQIQHAIDAVVAQQGVTPFTSTIQILIVEDGVYEKFKIDDYMLTPTSTCRLEIKAADSVTAIVSGNLTLPSTGADAGCYIGAGIPYVTIQKLIFKNFIKGIICSVNSHQLLVNKNLFVNISNTAIWLYNCDQCQIFNNLIVNAKYGIAATKVKDVAIIYNSVFNDVDMGGENNVCLYVDTKYNATEPSIYQDSVATIYNNLLYSALGTCIVAHERDLESNLVSNFNNFFSPSGNVAKVLSHNPTAGTTSIDYQTLEDWRNISNQDSVSISDNPLFLHGDVVFDIDLLPASPCIGAGVILCNDPQSLLSAYIDDTELCSDIFDQTRSTVLATTIGANEVAVEDGFFDIDIFTSILSQDQSEVICGTKYSRIDLVKSKYANGVECWNPEIKSGHFYIREKPYYLYSEKAAYDLSQITRTEFLLARPIKRDGAQVFVGGTKITDQKYWRLDGNRFYLYHLDLDIPSLHTEVIIKGNFQDWNGNSFHNRHTEHRFKLKDGIQTYWLPSNPQDNAPIVITDDTISLLDNTGLLPMQFYTNWEPVSEQTEVVFTPNTNLLQNPQYEYGYGLEDAINSLIADTGTFSTRTNPIRRKQEDHTKRHVLDTSITTGDLNHQLFRARSSFVQRLVDDSRNMVHHGFELPYEYEVSTGGNIACRTFAQVDNRHAIRPLMGRQFLVVDIPTGDTGNYMVSQDIKINPNSSYYFSTYMTAPNLTGNATVQFEFLDHNYELLDTKGPYTYSIDAAQVASGSTGEYWERVGIALGNTEDTTHNLSAVSIGQFDTGLVSMHTGATNVIVSISAATGYPVAFDCMQFEESTRPSPYNRIPLGGDLTIEYENSAKGFYKIKDLTINPIRNSKANGFLQIGPVSAGQFDTGAPLNTTTLTDWFWPYGRLNILPWAKVHGLNKYHRMNYPSATYRGDNAQEFTWDLDISNAEQISTIPGVPVSMQDSSGDYFAIFTRDKNNNPYAFNTTRVEIFDDKGEFPGYISTNKYGIPIQVGQAVEATSNSKGVVSVKFTAPNSEDIEYRGDKPTIQTSIITGDLPVHSKSFGVINTYYPVSRTNHGNITVHDQYDQRMNLVSSSVLTGYLTPSIGVDGNTHYDLHDYPSFGTLKIFNNMTGDTGVFDRELTRSINQHLEFGQYYFNEALGRIILLGATTNDIKVEYQRRLAWLEPENDRNIYIDQEVLNAATGDIVVRYDAIIRCKIVAEAPNNTMGLPARFRDINLIAQNQYIGRED